MLNFCVGVEVCLRIIGRVMEGGYYQNLSKVSYMGVSLMLATVIMGAIAGPLAVPEFNLLSPRDC